MRIEKMTLATMALCGLLIACGESEDPVSTDTEGNTNVTMEDYPAIVAAFGNEIDLANLEEYSNQEIPVYINKDNTRGNQITDAGATLGRVLFYDKNLSTNNTISCASCHQQAFAFGDADLASTGVNGTTGRHSMRLVNARFGDEERFFWDERAASLEAQTTQPIRDHAEMGFSGTGDDPTFDDLISKLEDIEYYQELFTFVYGDAQITEERMQDALAQFIRSIQSFDSKYDAGRGAVGNNNQNFPNFTDLENQGKTLFNGRPQFNGNGIRVGGGAGCNICHRAPEFDIDPNSRNNGATGVLGDAQASDFTITRSPTLRDLINPNGEMNGAMMHDGSMATIETVLDHYNTIARVAGNNNLDPRLTPGGNMQQLQLTEGEKEALVAFITTLSGSEVYTAEKWSDPFD